MAPGNIEKAITLLARETFWNKNDFDFAAKALWIGLRARWCGVATLVDGGRQLQVLAYRDKGRIRKADTYDIQGTPCEDLYSRAGDGDWQIFLPDNVSELFPDDALLKEMGVVSYRGRIFHDAEGAPAGHIFALSDEPQPNDLETRLYFHLVCQRTGDEYNRWKATEELKFRESKLAESEHLLADAIESISEGFVLYDADERFVLCNDNYREFYPKITDMLVPGTPVEDIVRATIERGQLADPVDGDAWIRMRLAQYRAGKGAHEQHISNGRWLLATERRTTDGGFVGIRTDITKTKLAQTKVRDLTNRLIQEQENERRKIARELHDDLGQKLALLAIELELIAHELPDDSDKFAAQMSELVDRSKEIARSIESVSRQLHPSILEQLGLTSALRCLCAEFGSHANLEVEFVDHRAPKSVPSSIAINLYRIAQEALINIRKHSDAQNAIVEMRGNGEEVSLTVSDSGVGFDDMTVDANSLGLVSMKERVRLLDGRIAIQSELGRGTRIEVMMPLSGQLSDPTEQSTESIDLAKPSIADTDNMPPL